MVWWTKSNFLGLFQKVIRTNEIAITYQSLTTVNFQKSLLKYLYLFWAGLCFMLLGYTVAKVCASPRKFNLVHQTISPHERDETELMYCGINRKVWTLSWVIVINEIVQVFQSSITTTLLQSQPEIYYVLSYTLKIEGFLQCVLHGCCSQELPLTLYSHYWDLNKSCSVLKYTVVCSGVL